MSRTQWNLVLLFLVVAVIGGAVWLSQNPDTSNGGAATATPNPDFAKLVEASATDINRLQVVDMATGKVLLLEKDGDNWEIRQPIQERADSANVQTVLTNLVGLASSRALLDVTTPLAEHGLTDKNGYHVIANLVNGQTIDLRVGNQSFDKSGYYVQVAGKSGVYVVASYNLSLLLGFVEALPKQIPTPDLTKSMLDLTAAAAATPTADASPTADTGATNTPSGKASATPTLKATATPKK